MKYLLSIIAALVLGLNFGFSQCYREAPFANGPFGDYTINGTATITFLLDGSKTLDFDSNFSTTAGPDLHVYLSESASVSTPGGNLTTPNTIDLGLLKNASGTQSYDLSAITPVVNLNSYTYVIIHCKQYDHYWGSGTFGANQGSDCASLLSVDDFSLNQIKISPTLVTNNELNIELTSINNSVLNIYSVNGQKMKKSVILKNHKNTINTSSFEKSIYLIQVIEEGESITKKIIIP